MKNGQVNDMVYSNNHDIIQVLATVIEVIREFLMQQTSAKIFITGSTDDRTIFYEKILTRYYKDFSRHFVITGLVQDENKKFIEIIFEPNKEYNFLAFFVKNKI